MHRKDRGQKAPWCRLALAAAAALLWPAVLRALERWLAERPPQKSVAFPVEPVQAVQDEATRSGLLRSIAHDLRGPLAAIMGAGDMLAEKENDLPRDTRHRLTQGIQSDAQWLLSVVDNLLSLTRAEAGGLAPDKTVEDAEAVAGQAVERFRRRYPDIAVSVVPGCPRLPVPMDALLVAQALGNLLDNAARHGHPAAADSAPAITVALAEQAGFALFTVADNGPGLSPAQLAALIAPSPPPAQGQGGHAPGCGMGLMVCRIIAQAHGGWLRAESSAGVGARLSLGLPLAKRGDAHGK